VRERSVGRGKENSYLIASYMIMFRPGLPKVGGQNTAWQHGDKSAYGAWRVGFAVIFGTAEFLYHTNGVLIF
jgi:hypothetical protein